MYQYITGLNGPSTVLQAIATFAAAAGWTVNRNTLVSTTGRLITLSAPGSCYVTLNAGSDLVDTAITGNLHRGINLTTSWNAQPDQFYNNTYDYMRVLITALPVTSIHAFGGLTPEPYLYFAIEMQPGYYRHINIGKLIKFASGTLGNTFVTCANVADHPNYRGRPNYHAYPLMYNDSTSFTERRKGGVDIQNSAGAPAWGKIHSSQSHSEIAALPGNFMGAYIDTHNEYSGRTLLVTPTVWLRGADDLNRPLGVPPAMRYINMALYQPGDEEVIGSDTWKIFPMIRRGPNIYPVYSWTDESSVDVGIAYLKV